MANSRHDPERDLDYIPRTYEGDPVLTEVPTKKRRPLTGRAGLEAAKRHEEKVARDKVNELVSYVTLMGTSKEQLAHNVEMVRRIKAGEIIGETTTPQVAEIVLPEQSELPLE